MSEEFEKSKQRFEAEIARVKTQLWRLGYRQNLSLPKRLLFIAGASIRNGLPKANP